MLSNNNLLFVNYKEIYLLDEKLNEIKRKIHDYYIYNIANFDKNIFIGGYKIYIYNLNLELNSIINYSFSFSTIYRSYINNYISFYNNIFTFIDNKKYMIYEYDIPYLFHANNNKLIFGRLRDEKNKNKNFKLYYKNKKIFILYYNNLLIYQAPN